jgi:two-component system cell cycle sensor histidine kinase/response regulator CckA
MSGAHMDRIVKVGTICQNHGKTGIPVGTALEEDRHQTQKLETLGRMTSGVAHDFNNVVTIMAGYSAILLQQLDHQDPLYEVAEGIKKASTWAATLAQRLTAFSRKQIIEPRMLNLNASVRNLEKVLPRLLGEDIEVVTSLAPTLGCILADPGEIEQLIINLAVNARDAMPMGGRLDITTTNIAVHEGEIGSFHFPQSLQPGPYIELSVSDTGCGIQAESQGRIFEPFYTGKPSGKGTGLGLSIVQEIVVKSGGAIRVDSLPAQGTTFTIVLPHVEQGMEDSPCPLSDRSLYGSETILLVEDEAEVRALMSRILKDHGYTIIEAPDGKAAMWASVRHAGTIDLLLTDLVMPNVNGRELAGYLLPLHPDMEVLYMSGYAKSPHFPQTVVDGSAPFISKPFTPNALVRKVRDVLDATCRV